MDKLVIVNGAHPATFQKALAAGGAQSRNSQYIEWLRHEGSEEILAREDYAKMFSLFGEGMGFDWMTRDLRAAYSAAWGGASGLRGMVNWYRATPLQVAAPDQPIPADKLAQIDPARLRIVMPHLLLWGMGDTALLPESRAGLDSYCDDLTVIEHATGDHWINHQHPDWVAGRIRDFLTRQNKLSH